MDIPDGVPNPLPPADTRFFFSEIGTNLTPFWIDDVKLQVADSATGWLWCESAGGTVGPGGQETVRICFDPAGLSDGTYQANLMVRSNDPDEPSVQVPVQLTVSGSPVENQEESNIPGLFALHPNYPNPFNPVTTISYTLDSAAEVRLAVYNVAGEEVAVLVDGRRSAGEHRLRFDGRSLQSGIYLCRLTAGSRTQMRKMALVK